MSVSDNKSPINAGKTNFFSNSDLTSAVNIEAVFSNVANVNGAIVYRASMFSKGTIASFPALMTNGDNLMGGWQAANTGILLSIDGPIYIPPGLALYFQEIALGVTSHAAQSRTVNYTLL